MYSRDKIFIIITFASHDLIIKTFIKIEVMTHRLGHFSLLYYTPINVYVVF